MISGAIDESALLHVHTSYLTRYCADEFSALTGSPLFLFASFYPLSRFSSRPFFTSSSSSSSSFSVSSSLLFSFTSSPCIAAAVIAVVVVAAVAASSSYSRQCHRTHVPRNRTVFSSVAWRTMRPPSFPRVDRRSPIDDSDRKVDEDSGFLFFCLGLAEALHYFCSCVEKCRLDVQSSLSTRKKSCENHVKCDITSMLHHTQERWRRCSGLRSKLDIRFKFFPYKALHARVPMQLYMLTNLFQSLL